MIPYNYLHCNQENKIDLHIHTNKSDGTKTPKELLIECKQLGLKIISITDHESVAAYNEIDECRNLFSGIIIPGIELKVLCQKREIELLGYGISINEIRRKLPTLYKIREDSNKSYLKAILNVLQKQGIILPKNIEELYTDFRTQPSKFVSNFILNYTENIEHNRNILFSDKIIHTDKDSLYRNWLTNPQSNFYVEFPEYPDYNTVIDLIHSCGGKVFIPHIFKYGNSSKLILNELLQTEKIDGIECYYPTFLQENIEYLLKICTNYNLFISGGSDYHGANKQNQLERGLNNNLYIPKNKIQNWITML